jgi:hypothetical protein
LVRRIRWFVVYRVSARRSGASVVKGRCAGLDEAVAWVEGHAKEAERGPRLEAIDLRARTFAPEDRIAARVQLAGPQRLRPDVRAGLDVRGDGSVRAWTADGATGRAELEPAAGEDAYAALRRALGLGLRA